MRKNLHGNRIWISDSIGARVVAPELRERPAGSIFEYNASDHSFYVLHVLSSHLLHSGPQVIREPVGRRTEVDDKIHLQALRLVLDGAREDASPFPRPSIPGSQRWAVVLHECNAELA